MTTALLVAAGWSVLATAALALMSALGRGAAQADRSSAAEAADLLARRAERATTRASAVCPACATLAVGASAGDDCPSCGGTLADLPRIGRRAPVAAPVRVAG